MKSYKEMESVDLRLRLLSGSSIKVDNFEIASYTLEEIINGYGYSNYMINLQWLSLTIDDFIKSVTDLEKKVYLQAEKSKLRTFDFHSKLGSQETMESLMIALAMVFKTEDVLVLEEGVIAVDFVKNGILVADENGQLIIDKKRLEEVSEDKLKMVHRDNFDDIVEAVRIANYLSKPVEKAKREDNPADEETRQLLEQMRRNAERVEQIKKRQMHNDGEDDDDIDISDIISAVTAKSNSINKLNVWKLTLYQLYDEYARLELIDNYDFSIKAMMAGAEKIDLKHWSSKL